MIRCFVICLLAIITLPLSAQYNIKKLMGEGRKMLDMGYYVASLQIFNRIVALKPNLYEAWYLMALSKYRLEDYKGAYEDCGKALELQPYIADIFELYGMACIREEQYDSAVVAYTKALEINPDNRDYWYNRAYSFYMGNYTKEALSQLDYILKRWQSFELAATLREEIRLGRKPRQNPSGTLRTEWLKLNTLNKGSWLMQRINEDVETKEKHRPISIRLH